MKQRWMWGVLLAVVLILLTSCAPAQPTSPEPTKAPEATRVSAATKAPEASRAAATFVPQPTPSPLGVIPSPSSGKPTTPQEIETIPAPVPTLQPTVVVEQHMIELEWPSAVRLGESDLVRMALVPYQDGYVVSAEFPEHVTAGQSLPVTRRAGYTLVGLAVLDGVGFTISPQSAIEHVLPAGEVVTWRWTLSPKSAGQQRLSISLTLRWMPEAGVPASAYQQNVFSRGLTVQVGSLFGMTHSQALTTAFLGLFFGAGLGAGALALRPKPLRSPLHTPPPNRGLVLEPRADIHLGAEEVGLLQRLFGRYARLAVEGEFLSGYSGARTFLALPLHGDGGADAYTIVKIGSRASIEREAHAYEQFVKDRLPPVTARIQHAPVTQPGGRRAALRYTFISEPGRLPITLRLALLADPDPALLWRLFDTFRANWWMQRRAYAFRWGSEYDLLLPPHLVLEPLPHSSVPARLIDDHSAPETLALAPGDLVRVGAFRHSERRADGVTLTLFGRARPGQARLRLRWLSDRMPNHSLARVTATRAALLRDWTAAFDRRGWPDPLDGLAELLGQTVQGTQSIIHGDLNLENVLVGPGGLPWLIDFSETREGHPLMDFAHLAAEIIVHFYAPSLSADHFSAALAAGELPLLTALEGIAARCLFNPAERSEYHTALRLACLGALKYPALDEHARELLYLTAAWSLFSADAC